VEHLSQLERAIPNFILKKVQVTEHVEYPNKPKNLKTKVSTWVRWRASGSTGI